MPKTYKYESTGFTDWHSNTGHTIRTGGCVIFMALKGKATVSVNKHTQQFAGGDILILTSDIYFSIEYVSEDFSVRYISLSKGMLDSAYYKIPNYELWEFLHRSPILRPTTTQQNMLSQWMDQNEWIINNVPETLRTQILNNNTYNLFIVIGTCLAGFYRKPKYLDKDRGWAITSRFLLLLSIHVHSKRDVKFYADKMSITTGYLYQVCRNIYGVSPKALINEQLTIEIKTLLTDTDLSVKNIADKLGFEDSSYMCRLFRKETNMSPMQFRNKSI